MHSSTWRIPQDFSTADAVFDCIGDAGDELFSFQDLTTPGAFWQGTNSSFIAPGATGRVVAVEPHD